MAANQHDVYIPSRAEETQNHSHRAYCPATDAIEWFRNRTVFRTFLWLTSRADVAHIIPNAYSIKQRFGNQREFKFEFRVRYWDRTEELIAIRRSCDLIPGENDGLVPPHWDVVSGYCKREGLLCRFLTEEHIRPFHQRINNWERILPYLQLSRQVPDPTLRADILKRIQLHKSLTLSELISAFPAHSAQEVISQAFSLVWKNKLGADLDSTDWSTSMVMTEAIAATDAPPEPKPISAEVNPDERKPIAEDPETWEPVPPDSIADEVRRQAYRRNRGIVWDRLMRGKKIRETAESFNCSRGWVSKLVGRCQRLKENGEPWGWEGAIPFARFPDSTPGAADRPSIDVEDLKKKGRALTRCFAAYPEIQTAVIAAALPAKKSKATRMSGRRRVSAEKVWKVFLKACEAEGIPPDQWPNNTADKGREAIRRFVRKLENTKTREYIEANLGDGALVVWDATQPKRDIEPVVRPYAYFQADGHDSNAYSAISLPDMMGMNCVLPLGRFWFVVCIDVGSRAAMGYTITPELNYGSIDLLDSIFNGLAPWERHAGEMPDKSYRPGAGMPNGVYPFCTWRGIDMIRLDNALAHLSREAQERIVQTTGAVVVTSRPDRKTSNAVVERFFGSFENVFGRGPSSTGSNPKDVVREDPEGAAIRHRIELFLLEGLGDAVLANYNATPHSTLNGRTPLQYLRDWHRMNPHLARYIPDSIQADMPLFYRTFPATIARNKKQGGACYIQWLYSRHTNDLIASTPSLAGTQVMLTVDSRDARLVWAHTLRGEPLGQLEPQDRWALRAHTLRERRIIGSFRNANLIDTDTTDPVGDLHEIIHQKAQLDSSARRKFAAQRYPNPTPNPTQTPTSPGSAPTPREWIPITGHYYK